MKRTCKLLALVLVMALSLAAMTGCYFRKEVSSNQVGLRMHDGVSIDSVVGPGRYGDMSWYADMRIVDASAKTLTYTDPDVWTKDKQVVTFAMSVTYARKTDTDSVTRMWSMYNAEAQNDEALAALVQSRIPRSVKQVTTQMTLDEMLGIATGEKNRETLQNDISTILASELDACGIQLLDLGVNNIGADETYTDKQREKATASIEVELAKEKTKQLQEQLTQEQAQTEIDLEKARRNNLVAEEEAKVYETSTEAYELKKLELLSGVIGDSDKVYFVPEGADLTLFLSGQGEKATPVPVGP